MDEPVQRRESRITQKGYRLGMKPGNWKQTLPPTLLSRRDVEGLLDKCGSGRSGLRSRAAIGLLYRTGISAGEVVELETDDVDLTPGEESVHIHTGRLAHRVLSLDAPALQLLLPWIELRRGLPGDRLFCITEGETIGAPWGGSNLRAILTRLGKSAGIERLHPGAFRHSLAADLIVEQWPLPYIQAQLGIVTLYAFKGVFEHLGIDTPADIEVMEVSRYRPPWTPGLASSP